MLKRRPRQREPKMRRLLLGMQARRQRRLLSQRMQRQKRRQLRSLRVPRRRQPYGEKRQHMKLQGVRARKQHFIRTIQR